MEQPMMDENPPEFERGARRGKQGNRLLARAIRERWGIKRAVRGRLLERLKQCIDDLDSGRADVDRAARTMLGASKNNLSNIEATMKAEKHTELEWRLLEVEKLLEERKAEEHGWPGP
jgi:hypothetical protein